ncbi:DsbA family oxidoreductase [Amycolatopsis benzoatilytica]|uniref:DsbA family oxidoreductase n=1 Tax=Amycolatopsis benzoatilytica TaxID=346045 RepID=UPI00037F3DC4|nr:DsbA family oxidoreductase [Amycolatopsis benzoatilytica]
MQVEIWSDVVCPWCYLGKARFEKALAGFAHRDEVTVVYRSFELDPGKVRTEPLLDMLTAKYGPQAAEMEQRVAGLAAEEGLGYRTDREIGNTFDAHRLLHLAREKGLEGEMVSALFRANFAEARAVFDAGVLVEVAVEAGLSQESAEAVLGDPERYAEAVRAEEREAVELGAGGVPFFVLGRRFGVSGGQSVEVFEKALERAWEASA